MNYMTDSFDGGQHHHSGLDSWVEFAAMTYVADTMARDAAIATQQYWESVEQAEHQTLINMFNYHRNTYADHAARWYAEKDFFATRRDRFIGYFTNAPGYKWRHRLPFWLAVIVALYGIQEVRVNPGERGVTFLVALVLFGISRWVKTTLMPRYADGYLAQMAQQEKYNNDVQAFNNAQQGYIEGGWR